MGIIRGFLLVIVSVILFLSLFAFIFLWILSSSLSYGNFEKEAANSIREFLPDAEAIVSESVYLDMQAYCQNNSDYVFNSQDYTLSISCSIAMQGREAVAEEALKGVVKDIYYAEYDCNFWDCFEKSDLPIFLVSQKAHTYWKQKLFIILSAFFFLAALAFLLIEKKTSLPVLLGSFWIIVGLIFVKIDAVFSFFPETLSRLLGIFFSQSGQIAVKVFLIGGVLIAAGIILKIFKIGFKVSEIASEVQKETGKKQVQTVKAGK
jgi:hypothetical protein